MTGSEYVTLPGLTLPIAAVLLALDLESRGVQIAIDGGDLIVTPRHLITDEDRRQIKLWKLHLRALLAHVESVQ